MRITKENSGISDFTEVIANLQEQYGEVYWNTIDGEMFIHRALTRLEYKELVRSEANNIDKEDAVCKTCILYPEEIDLDEYPAGIPTKLFEIILKNSFLDSIDAKLNVVNYFRNEMQEFDNQITCIINEAFPNFDIEEVENWDMQTTAKYLSRAEWKLNVLRQIPIDYSTSNEMMKEEWNAEHSKDINTEEISNNKEDSELEDKTNGVEAESIENKEKFKSETLKERQNRLNQDGPRKKTAEEIARFKKLFPEIDWGSEVDLNNNIDNMKDSVDVTAPALRPGW